MACAVLQQCDDVRLRVFTPIRTLICANLS